MKSCAARRNRLHLIPAAALLAAAWIGPAAVAQPAPEGGGLPQDYYAWAQPLNFEDSLELGPLTVCFDAADPPDPEFIASMMAELRAAGRLRQPDPSRYYAGARWSGATGTPRALTWSFVPDGLSISGGVGEPVASSNLFATLDAAFVGQGGRVRWVDRFQACFDRWAAICGTSYSRITVGGDDWDDGAAWGSAGGATRGDIRISMHLIDRSNGILAYTYFPSNGDMVFDSGESGNWASASNMNRFLRNTIMHEHGHSLGIDHVCSNTNSFLMEPFLSTAIDGPQHDDIRAGQRLYGDQQETDSSAALASNLGALIAGQTINDFCNLPAPISGSNPPNSSNCALSVDSDADWFKFTTSASLSVSTTITPLGFSYDSTEQAGDGSCPNGTTVNSLTAANIEVALVDTNGVTVLASATAAAAGIAETISGFSLSTPGTYFLRVKATGSSVPSTQMYGLSLTGSGACVSPSITTNPTPQSACVGGSASFSVVAGGTGPFSYDWRRNGVPLGAPNSATLTINPVSAGSAGNYDCVVTGACPPTATSSAAALTVNTPPSIGPQPPPTYSACIGGTMTLTLSASGTGPLSYNWRKNTVSLGAPSSPTLTVTPVIAATAGNYDCEVSGACSPAARSNTTVVAADPYPGDVDGDGDVDQDDMDIVLFHFGTSQPPGTNGDIDGDGDVDQDDMDIVLFNFGTSCP